MPLLGLLSRLVSAPPQKPHLAQNEAHPAPQQRYSSHIVNTWPLHTGNTLASPQSTNQRGLSTQKLLLGLLSRLVSAPPQKPHLAQNEAHPAPPQRCSSPIVSTWPLHIGNTLALPQSTNQRGLSTQNAPPRSPLSPRERTTSEAAAPPNRSTHGPAATLRHPHRQYLAAAHRKHTCLTSKYQPAGALDSKCPSSVSSLAS